MHHCISTKRINEKIAIIHLSQWMFKISDFLAISILSPTFLQLPNVNNLSNVVGVMSRQIS